MNNNAIKNLCLNIMKADAEEDVIGLLQKAGYWDEPSAWRYYGDNENNYSTIGNQQSRPDAALVEKVVNSADARLMNECLVREIDPESSNAPKTIREAISYFFEDNPNPKSELAGNISEWVASKRTAVARGITLAATGFRPREGKPCFSIADIGEGQTPDLVPNTFMSLHRSNKLRIPFVQGKFNMGGTGALKFCGNHNLEFILTRRNPKLLNNDAVNDDKKWGFTIVRREDPRGGRRSSVYTYLAPVEIDGQKNGVLRFDSKNMPILPEIQNPYSKSSEWGTLLKLYEYSATGYYNSHMFRRDGLQERLDILLPDVALPIRLHECRNFKGAERSFETTLTGLGVRLSDDKAKNLEKDFPCSCPIRISGEELTATIYAFKKGRADTYRKNEGVIFTVNGQTHGHLTRDFFRRKKIGLSYIADSILIIINCNSITGRSREDLFMNSRDRLCGGELRSEIEKNLIELLSKHEGLRELKNKRREEEIQSKLDDSKPLEDILESLLKQSPALASLFLHGTRIANPFKTKNVKPTTEEYVGEKFPTFFKFKGKDAGTVLNKNTHINYRCRISFETDAENDYFSRKVEKGQFDLYVNNNCRIPVDSYVGPNLQNGIASLSVELPKECKVGDEIEFIAQTTDMSRMEPFINKFVVNVLESAETNGKKGKRRKPPKDEDGNERELPSGIALPNITQVREENWELYDPPFNKNTALRVIHAGESEVGEKKDIYDFFVNMDNIYLKSDLKSTSVDVPLVEARFIYGMALIGLSILHDTEKRSKDNNPSSTEEENGKNVEHVVETVTQAIAPILLPMIDGLGALDITDVENYAGSGEVD